ncbi:MAG: hypothetical protein WC533_00685 [Candidatus Pacearchaeota archaeon]
MKRRIELTEVLSNSNYNNCTIRIYKEGEDYPCSASDEFCLWKIDNHYVLQMHLKLSRNVQGYFECLPEVFGVSDTLDEAQKRLHEKSKLTAEKLAEYLRLYGDIIELVDNTKFAPERLPRGGK